MATSIVKRLVRLIRATAHDTLDTIEDPGATAREMLRELRAEIAKTEEATASVIADQKAIQKKRDAAHAMALDWNAKAEQAVRQQRDDLATAALEYATRAERNVTVYDESLSVLSPRVAALRAKLDELRGKLDDANNEAELLDARAKAASATSRAARVLGNVGDNPIDFDGVRARVDKIEAESEALDELAHDKAGNNIAAELAALTREPVADRLAVLKEKVGAGAEV
ncbi:PspA/IM30 family protein [Paraburkholderia sp. SIMBA_009]